MNYSDMERQAQGAYPRAQQPSQNKTMEQALDVLYRRRWIIIVTFLLVAAGAMIHAFSQEPWYQANAIIMVDLGRMPGTENVVAEGSTPFVRSDRTVATELFILQNSYTIAQRVNQRLEDEREGEARPRGGVQFGPASRSINNAIMVSSTSASPEDAARLANVYAEEYVRQTQDASRSYLSTSRSFLEEQEAQRRQELRTAEDAVEAYMRRTGAVGLGAAGAAVVGRLANVEAQRDESRIDLQVKQTQLETIERELEAINPRLAQRVSSDIERRMAAIQAELTTLETERQTILTRAAGGGQQNEGRLQTLNRQIASLQSDLNALSERQVEEILAVGGVDGNAVSYAAGLKQQATQLRIEIDGLQSRIGNMNTRAREYQGELSSIPGQSTELARLERTRQHAEQMYQYVVQRLQETEIAEQSEPGYARILRKAAPPAVPGGPNRFRTVLMGLLFGLGLGVALAALRDKVDNRIYKPDQLRARDIDVIGVIPDMRHHIKHAHDGAAFVEHEGRELSTSLVTQLDPLSVSSESYRHLRTAVQFSRPGVVVQTVVVTSAAPAEGKSTTAANLALTMAQAKRRTLLIDADLRRPQQHRLFDLDLEPGLVQILEENEPPLGFQQSAVAENLFVLPAGALPEADMRAEASVIAASSPAEILGSKRMRDVLEALRGQFDVIIIDTPPVLATTDAVLLSTQADATLIVVGAGKTKEGDLDHSLDMLSDVGANVIGTVLNRFDLSMAYGYKYSYGHYTKQGPYNSYGAGSEPKRSWWQRKAEKV
jgi:capsular exopolysaccharide synthesis family protein